MRRRFALAAGGLALLALGAVGWRALAPRERPEAVSWESPAGRILGATQLPARLWIARPHQNLGLIERRFDLEGWLAAAARLAQGSPPRLPRVGPFAAPPATEVALGGDPDRDAWIASARVLGPLAPLLRLSGRLAGNRWLAGGEVRVAGHPARVRWAGRDWILEAGVRLDELGRSERPAAGEPALARAVFRPETGSWAPPGAWSLRRKAGLGLVAEAERPLVGEAVWRLQSLCADPDLAAVVVDAPPGGPPEAIAGRLLRLGSDGGGLPGLGAFAGPGRELPPLPGEELLSLRGAGSRQASEGPFRLRGFDRASLAAARRVSAELAGPAGRGLVRAAWIRPDLLARTASAVSEALAALPLFGRREAQPWRDLATLLGPFAACGEVVLVTRAGDPPTSRAILCGPPPRCD